MTETKFTPGPWRIKEGGNIGNVVEAHVGEDDFGETWKCVALYQSALPKEQRFVYPDEPENAEANAHLIAAAPSLYKVLERAVELVETEVIRVRPSDRETLMDWLTNANTELAKARGET
jgi:hypothetical protein